MKADFEEVKIVLEIQEYSELLEDRLLENIDNKSE
jgi:hypothetical protein